ncbi:MAG TPA: diguanylate cyclase [Anaerolineales bacterium]|nr:diguanylate cyclase [Anaerolineales bacterium]
MKEMSFSTKTYLCAIYAAGLIVFAWHVHKSAFGNPWMLVVLCILASLSLIFKVAGATNRSYYTFSFLVYGFTFSLYGTAEAILVIAISNLAEWIWNRPAWYIQLFNAGCYILVMQVAGLVYDFINPAHILISWQAVIGIAASMAIFNLMNHLAVGIVVWLARGENFKTSGIFDFFPLMLDLTLLYFGASLSFVWTYNYFALVLFLVPLYLIYNTLRVPALERQSETDSKTGLFNHRYFKQQFENELNRANRFDRPLTIIMADLDLLRNINNTYGHLAGDKVLVGIAKVLRESVREYDIVSRFGGEEFAIMLPETTLQQAYERAENIRKAIEGTEFTVPTSVTPIRVTMSFGIACRERYNQTADEITHNADTALYHSKLSGRNRAFAYAADSFVNFGDEQEDNNFQRQSVIEIVQAHREPIEESSAPAVATEPSSPQQNEQPAQSESKTDSSGTQTPARSSQSNIGVTFYIGAVALVSLLAFAALYRATTPIEYFASSAEWAGLFMICILIAASEWLSIDLYFRQTAVSTSAIPILAGYLLFGPIGTFTVSLIVAIALLIKHRSPMSRFIFNFSNHVLAGTLCTSLILVTGKNFLEWDPVIQAGLGLISAVVLYLSTTWLIAFGLSLDLKQSARDIWRDQYNWLGLHYMGIGLIAYALVFGYQKEGLIGTLFIVAPMILLRFSQKQYLDRTREVVNELRENNQALEKSHREINNLNEGLLETLAEIIDLRDSYMLGHSRQVAKFATDIAGLLGLHEKQVELVRRGGLLHDIGKLGIAMELLSKPGKLTPEEHEEIKKHAALGATLVEKNLFLRSLSPMIRHHHEYYNGQGYPDGLQANEIPIEARILAVADAIDTMAFDRPYRKRLSVDAIVAELNLQRNSQFDPLIVDAATILLTESSKLPNALLLSRGHSDLKGALVTDARPV